jgi:hypothetical protein
MNRRMIVNRRPRLERIPLQTPPCLPDTQRPPARGQPPGAFRRKTTARRLPSPTGKVPHPTPGPASARACGARPQSPAPQARPPADHRRGASAFAASPPYEPSAQAKAPPVNGLRGEAGNGPARQHQGCRAPLAPNRPAAALGHPPEALLHPSPLLLSLPGYFPSGLPHTL